MFVDQFVLDLHGMRTFALALLLVCAAGVPGSPAPDGPGAQGRWVRPTTALGAPQRAQCAAVGGSGQSVSLCAEVGTGPWGTLRLRGGSRKNNKKNWKAKHKFQCQVLARMPPSARGCGADAWSVCAALSISLCHTLSLALALSHSLTLTHSHSLTHSLSLSLSLSLSVCLSVSLSHPLTVSLPHSLSPCLPPSLPPSLPRARALSLIPPRVQMHNTEIRDATVKKKKRIDRLLM